MSELPDIDFNGRTVPVPETEDSPIPDHKATKNARTGERIRKVLTGNDRKASTTGARGTRTKASVPKMRPGYFVEPIERLYGVISLAVALKAPETAKTIAKNAHEIAIGWDDLAQHNDAVRKLLIGLTATSDWGKLFVLHTPIIFAAMNESGGAANIVSLLDYQQAQESTDDASR